MARFSFAASVKKLFTRTVSRTATADRRVRLGAESLETRVVPAVTAYVDIASKLLVVSGTTAGDNIYVNHDSGGVHVRTGSTSAAARTATPLKINYGGSMVSGVSASALQPIGNGYAVWVDSKAGNDAVEIDSGFGLRTWLSGGDGNDILVGGAAADYLDGWTGDDALGGMAGNDIIYAGTGADYVVGGTGNDSVFGDTGDDALYGEDGTDLIYGGVGNDYVDGGNGNDTLYGRTGNDRMYGRAGDDAVHGEDGNDSVYGNEGNDIVNAGTGADYAAGGTGNDSVFGDTGNDYLYGDEGNDTMYGGADNDHVDGGTGNDTLYGRGGNDFLFGRAGNDTMYGEDGKDVLYGHEGVDKLYGGSGDDYLHGGAGDDTIEGGSGTDTFRRNLYFPSGFSLQDDPEDTKSDIPVDVSGAFLTAPASGARPTDVDQQASPTCTILASLASVAAKVDLESKIRYNASSDTYTIDLYVDGVKRAFNVNGDWTEGRDPGKALWVTLYQKAYLQAMGVVSRGSMGELMPSDDWTSTTNNYRMSKHALHALTGLTTVYTAATSATPQTLQAYLASSSLKGIIASSKDTGTTNNVVGDHAYRVVSCWQSSGTWYVKLQNPWGRDGRDASTDGNDDGFVTLSWNTFKANFDGFTRAGG